MKRNCAAILLVLCALAVVLSACGNDSERGSVSGGSSEHALQSDTASVPQSSSASQEPEGVTTLDVMFFPLGQGEALFFVQSGEDTDSPLFLRLPEDLRDENGEPAIKGDLNRGDVIRLYFSKGYSIKASSPGQLATEADYAQIIHRGKPEDADKYQKVIENFYQPQALNLPHLQFTHFDAGCRGGSMAADTETYEWDYEDENGTAQHVENEAAHPLLRQDISEIPMACAAPLELYLDGDVQSVEVRRWPASSRGDDSLPEGELVHFVYGSVTAEGVESLPAASNGPQRIVVEDAGPSYVYEVRGQWEQGFAAYAFLIYQDDGYGNRIAETLCAVMGPAGHSGANLQILNENSIEYSGNLHIMGVSCKRGQK